MAGIAYAAAKIRRLGIGPVTVDKDTTNATILGKLKEGQTLINATINVSQDYDAGYSFSVGTPADHDAFVKSTDINFEQIRLTECNNYYTAMAETTVAIYITGTSTQGATIFLELL